MEKSLVFFWKLFLNEGTDTASRGSRGRRAERLPGGSPAPPICAVQRWGGRCGGGDGEDGEPGGASNDDVALLANFDCWRAVAASLREGLFRAEWARFRLLRVDTPEVGEGGGWSA